MSMCAITTRTELTLDLGRTLLVIELQNQRLQIETRSSRCRDSVVCITAIPSRPNKSAAVHQTRSPSGSEGDSRLDLCNAAFPRASDTLRTVEVHTMQR